MKKRRASANPKDSRGKARAALRRGPPCLLAFGNGFFVLEIMTFGEDAEIVNDQYIELAQSSYEARGECSLTCDLGSRSRCGAGE